MNRPALGHGVRIGLFTGAIFAANAVTSGFLPLWLADRGVAAAAIGVMLGAGSAIRVLAVPGWGLVADRAGRLRPPMLAACLAATLTAAAFPAVRQFWPLLLLLTLNGVAASALSPLTDTLTVAHARHGRLLYGRTRAWGSVSYMLATAAAGPLLSVAGSPVVPWLIAGAFAAATVLVAGLPEAGRTVHARVAAGPGLFRNPAFRLAVAASALIQGSHAAYYGFAALHWRQSGLGDTTIGLLIAEGITMEIVLFVWGGPVTERLGPARLTALAAGACILRWTVLGLTTSLPVLAVVQVLHAGSFAMQHLSSIAVMRAMPASRSAAAQAVHSALGFSAPTGLLIWVSGALYTRSGSIFLLMALIGGSALLLVAPLARAVGQPALQPTRVIHP